MLTKLLILIAVTTGALLFTRNKNIKNQQPLQADLIKTIPSTNKPNINAIAFSLLLLTLLTGSTVIFLNWQDDHRVYEIRIINPQTGTSDNFEAYKKEIKGRYFTTTTGQQVTASKLERIEILERK